MEAPSSSLRWLIKRPIKPRAVAAKELTSMERPTLVKMSPPAMRPRLGRERIAIETAKAKASLSNNKRNKASEDQLDPLRRSIAVCTRAIALRRGLEVMFGFDNQAPMPTRINLPSLPARLMARDAAILRGHADSAALWLAHSDPKVHNQLAPSDPQERAIFDALEQARVEAIGSRRMIGTAGNLAAMLEARYISPRFAGISTRADAPIEVAVAIMVRERLNRAMVPAHRPKWVELWRPFVERAASDLIEQLDALVEDQAAFASVALKIIGALADRELPAPVPQPEPVEDKEEEVQTEKEPGPLEGGDRSLGPAEGVKSASEDSIGGEPIYGDAEKTDIPGNENFAEPLHLTRRDPSAPSRKVQSLAQIITPDYRIYTTRFDEIVRAEELATVAQLRELRLEVDERLRPLHGLVARLAHKLERRLQAQHMRFWEYDVELGTLDTARLTRVVTDPLAVMLYKQERDGPFRDTVVTLLLDNSGSMRGHSSMVVAVCADILARTLERCGVKVEILGFTTRSWRGGQARQAWLEAGRPYNPGRLNDLRHIIYKSADMPWRRARLNLGLLTLNGLHKENIDGEALAWAHQRLARRPEKRRILMMISDGAPVDESTLAVSVSAGNYLEHHLLRVVDEIERRGAVELFAIGIGYDVTRFYPRSVKIDHVDQLGRVLIGQLTSLLEPPEQDVNIRRRRAIFRNVAAKQERVE
jgi:cobaltochelatase CobT